MSRDKTILIYAQDYIPDGSSSKYPDRDCCMPLGILYLGSHLDANGKKVKLLDTRLYKEKDFFAELDAELSGCILAGLSVTTPCIKRGLEISEYIKKKNPSIKIVWGGIHSSLFPEATVSSRHIDYVVVKEGEGGLLGLVEHLIGERRDILDIPNLIFKQDSKIHKNPQTTKDNSARIGVTNYALLDIHKYLERVDPSGCRKKHAEIITSRGCPWRCAFCVNTILYKRSWRDEGISNTLERLDGLIGKYGVEHVTFMDEDFFCNRKKMKRLVTEIGKRSISWDANCRADYIKDDYIDDDFLKLLKKSGCQSLRFGLESGSQRVLEMLKKDIKIEDSLNMARQLKRYGITPSVSLMMGLPDETTGDILKTTKLIAGLLKINPETILIGPTIFRPYPGSELFKRCEDKGLVIPEVLEEWSDFYLHNSLDEYRNGVPWFNDTYIFKKVWLCLAHLKVVKTGPLRLLVQFLTDFHIMTRFKFIPAEYFLFRAFKKITQ